MDLQEKIQEWLKWDKNPETLATITDLVNSGAHEKLYQLLMNRISFGTAGLRGRMGAGYTQMNELVVIQTAQGLLKHLTCSDSERLTSHGLVIGYDGRYNSKRFAELTASIFAHAGHSVLLFGTVVATPFVAFAVRKYKCAGGVMVTASHNPKEDNGYKVYAANGAQIIAPADKLIHKEILAHLEPWPTSWDTSILTTTGTVTNPLDAIVRDYTKTIVDSVLNSHRELNRSQRLLFTYTPMHGVAYDYMKIALDSIDVRFVVVEEQQYPDPEFSTVKFPNPEEGKSSLDLAFKTADANNSRIIIANDPDADRMAAAEKQLNDQWRIFTGNELGALLGWWSLYSYKLRYQESTLDEVVMMSSTVSSKILQTMAKQEHFHFVETLTGFKWMGNKTVELLERKKHVIFAFEEAIGFMCGTAVLDKDGISAACQFATMVSFIYSKGGTLTDKLDELYRKYGYHASLNSYYICDDQQKIVRIFNRIRQWKSVENQYPNGILNDKYLVETVRDLTTGFDSSQPDKKAILPVSKSSQMITLIFTNGFVCTLRTSGTEPKIKYYTEMCADPETMDKIMTLTILKEMVNGIVDELLQPQINELTPKAD